MKRFLAVLLAAALIVCGVVTACAADTVTALEKEYRNVAFSNGFRGFCVDYGLEEALVGDQFTLQPSSAARNNASGEEISAYLKAVFTEGFHYFFVKGNDGVYAITQDTWDLPQRACWHFSDGYESYWEDISPIVEAAKTAVEGGLVIPDSGYTKMVDETTEVTFEFALMETMKDGQQCFFAYAVSQRTVEQNQEPNDPPADPDLGDGENEGTNDPPVPPAEEETPTDTPDDPAVTPTDPAVTPTDPAVTPTDPCEPEDNNGGQMGEDEDGKNPPTQPEPVPPSDGKTDVIIDYIEDEQKPKTPAVTPTDNPATGDGSVMTGALVCLAFSGLAVLAFRKKEQ